VIPIAYCIHGLRGGGAEHHLVKVFGNLDRDTFDPILFCLGDGGGDAFYEDIQRLGIRIVNLGMNGKLYHPRNILRLIRMAQLLRSMKVLVVHGYLLEGNLVGVLAGRLAGVPVLIASKRSVDEYRPLHLAACRAANRLSEKVTVNSVAVRDDAVSREWCPEEKLVMIYSGTECVQNWASDRSESSIREQLHIPAGAPVIGTVARFSEKKGYEYFIRMAAEVLKRRPHAHFVAVGDGPLMGRMKEMASQCGILEKVLFVGWQTEVSRFLRIFDVYVCSSIVEGLSNAMLEAMAHRVPVVATGVGGNLDVVDHGVTGYLVPSKNPTLLCEAIIRILDDPEMKEQMGEAGYQRVFSHYSLSGMVRKMEELYKGLLRGKGVMEVESPLSMDGIR